MAASGSELCTIDQLNDLKQFIINKIPSVTDPLDAYPVGSVYISYTSTSPASRFGGQWTELKGVFPYFNHGTAPGGSNTHTLTVAQMPSHSHTFTVNAAYVGWDGTSPGRCFIAGSKSMWDRDGGNPTTYTYSKTDDGAQVISNTGSTNSHNNMPSYQTLYAWRRTA